MLEETEKTENTFEGYFNKKEKETINEITIFKGTFNKPFAFEEIYQYKYSFGALDRREGFENFVRFLKNYKLLKNEKIK